MKLHIIAIGPIRRGPEREMVDDYIARANRLGRGIGLREVVEHEAASGGGKDAEAERLLARCPPGAEIIALDERGRALTSRAFSNHVAARRDDGLSDLCFCIGGAEGHGAAIKAASAFVLGLGPQTWPHKLVRVMLSEQVYRAASLLAGTPYHKD